MGVAGPLPDVPRQFPAARSWLSSATLAGFGMALARCDVGDLGRECAGPFGATSRTSGVGNGLQLKGCPEAGGCGTIRFDGLEQWGQGRPDAENRVIEAGRLESLAIARAEWFASKPAEGLAAAKRMMTAAHWCLGSCFEAEEKAFQWCMSRKHAAERR